MSEDTLVAVHKDYELNKFKSKMASSDAKVDHPLRKGKNQGDPNQANLIMQDPLSQPEDPVTKKEEVRKHDPIAEYLEKEKKAMEPITWEKRKNEIMEQFKKAAGYGSMEIFMNEGGDRDLERPIRLGQGKSRLDQLQKKKRHGPKIAAITAEEFES